MTKYDREFIEEQIHYCFKNKDLLDQAFTRRSYTIENGGENNEVLEFIGDKVLDLAVVKMLTNYYGEVRKEDSLKSAKRYYEDVSQTIKDLFFTKGPFFCSCNEDELTKLKSRMVQKKNLSSRIDELGLAKYLQMGNGDIENNIQREDSVKEDLFEAILGAVAVDSNWDFLKMEMVVEAMLLPEDFIEEDQDNNYVRKLFDWSQSTIKMRPIFKYCEGKESFYFKEVSEEVISQNVFIQGEKFRCYVKVSNDFPVVFMGRGKSMGEARMNACMVAYDYLEKNNYITDVSMSDEIDEPTKEKSINQLEILARRGYFSVPTYSYEEKYDENGNPIWKCTCVVKEYSKKYSATFSSKKEAKKRAAFKMLKKIIEEDQRND